MKNIVTRVILFFFSALSATVLLGAPASFDPVRIEQITGLTGVYNQVSKVLTLAGSRIDVKVTVDQGVLPPATGLTYWAAFAPGKRAGQTAIHGELALFSDEVNPIMSVAFANGLDVTSLETHFFYDEPRVYFMELTGEGDWEKLAEALGRALDRVKQIRAEHPQPAKAFVGPAIPATNSITAEPLEKILGAKAESKEGIAKVTITREPGLNTWLAFGGADDRAFVHGQIALRER